jgi:hypothetical protein
MHAPEFSKVYTVELVLELVLQTIARKERPAQNNGHEPSN